MRTPDSRTADEGRRQSPRLTLLVVLLAALGLGAPAPTQAATYTVRQCDPSYTSTTDFFYPGVRRADAFFTVNQCATAGSLGLHANPFKTVAMNDGNLYLAWAPDGTAFVKWRASFQGGTGTSDGVLLWARACSDFWCNVSWSNLFFGYDDWGSPKEKSWSGGALALQVRMVCTGYGGSDGCQFGQFAPGLVMYEPEMTLNDAYTPAAPDLSGGSLLAGGWLRGEQSLNVQSSDRGGGVVENAIVVGGITRASRKPACAGPVYGPAGPAWTRLRPCPTEDTGAIRIDLSDLADGTHQFRVVTSDPAGQSTSGAPFNVLVDNTAPGAPASAGIDGGDGWRRHNDFGIHWENPIERFAPIAAVHWRLCPLAGGSCTSGRKPGADVTRLENLAAAGSGEHDLAIWLEDAAGNQDVDRARHIRLRLDTEAPTLSFARSNPADPLRVSVDAHDDQSGLADGEIEIRRVGGSSWHPVRTRVESSQLVGVVDDERFENGSYRLRARAVDGAGNQASTDRRSDGAQMSLRLPLRVQTRLRVGLPHVTRRANGRKVTLLRSSGRVRVGRRARIRGSLANRDGQPIDEATIHVYSKTRGSPKDFATVGLVHTDRHGRFSYVARATRSRVVRFRYPGSRRIRAQSRNVVLQVPAMSTIRSSDRSLLVGDSVTFRGRLFTGPIPRGGKLMEIQAFFRGRWRTFSTVRTNRRGGWHFGYRFGGTRGIVRYRFRIRIPPEAGYPFALGGSPTAFVTVRGP